MARANETTISKRIAEMAKEMGYSTAKDASKLSGSQYLGLNHEKMPDKTLKVRVSDHDLPPSYGSPGDYDVYVNERPSLNGIHWSDAVMHLAKRIGEKPPALAEREFNRRQEVERDKAEKELTMQRSNPAYQEGMLQQKYPAEWASAIAMEGAKRSDARRSLAARYEKENPGHLVWAPYLRPK